jgi:hypothetical protein
MGYWILYVSLVSVEPLLPLFESLLQDDPITRQWPRDAIGGAFLKATKAWSRAWKWKFVNQGNQQMHIYTYIYIHIRIYIYTKIISIYAHIYNMYTYIYICICIYVIYMYWECALFILQKKTSTFLGNWALKFFGSRRLGLAVGTGWRLVQIR